jgi:UDP-N-acetylglucosamine acyltransferase
MTSIHATAQVEPGAEIGKDVTVGPFCVIGPNVAVGDGCRLVANVHLTGHTTIGPRTVIYPFASLGTPPQSFKYRGGPTKLIVGADCDIRECVTMNIGTEDDGGVTNVGDHCLFMAGSHVGHDCKVGKHVVVANNVSLGGHVAVGDSVVFGGHAAVKQFVRIGEGAMIVGLSGIRADVIPWALASGPLANLVGLNVVGLRRRGFSKTNIHCLRQAYRAMFFGAGTFRARFAEVAADPKADPLVAKIIEFVKSGSRPLTMAVHRGDADGEL